MGRVQREKYGLDVFRAKQADLTHKLFPDTTSPDLRACGSGMYAQAKPPGTK
jgi:hypothetical protein